MRHPSDLPAWSKVRLIWEAKVLAALKELNKALREYTEFHEKGMP